jgi:hypothetical protein
LPLGALADLHKEFGCWDLCSVVGSLEINLGKVVFLLHN